MYTVLYMYKCKLYCTVHVLIYTVPLMSCVGLHMACCCRWQCLQETQGFCVVFGGWVDWRWVACTVCVSVDCLASHSVLSTEPVVGCSTVCLCGWVGGWVWVCVWVHLCVYIRTYACLCVVCTHACVCVCKCADALLCVNFPYHSLDPFPALSCTHAETPLRELSADKTLPVDQVSS